MQTNQEASEGFRGNPKYKRKPTTRGEYFPWRKSVEGCTALLVVGIEVSNTFNVEDLVKRRNFAQQGLTGQWILSVWSRWFPQIFVAYHEAKGTDIPKEVAYDRVHKMFIEFKDGVQGGVPVLSTEYYTYDMRLRPSENAVRRRMERSKKVITNAEAHTLVKVYTWAEGEAFIKKLNSRGAK